MAGIWIYRILGGGGERNVGSSVGKAPRLESPVLVLRRGEAHGQLALQGTEARIPRGAMWGCSPCVDHKKVREAGREAGQRDSAWERDAVESASPSWEVLQRRPSLIRLQSFGGGGQSCRSFTGCVVSR